MNGNMDGNGRRRGGPAGGFSLGRRRGMRKQKERQVADSTQATFWEIRSRLQPFRLLL